MKKFCLLFAPLLVSALLLHGNLAIAAGTDDGSEQWGYVEVRPKAHLFWWLYRSPYRVEDPSRPWPILLWLQGGPGASGIGLGNFLEMGPLDGNLERRNSTWLRKADLLFVNSPVGTGFSYVEDENLAVKTDQEAAIDLTTLLKELFNGNQTLQKSPLYIFAESYGGHFAVTLGLSALKAIEAGKLKVQLGGVALGNTWISPEDFVFSWGPLLKDLSRIDSVGLNKSNSLALEIQRQLAEGKYVDATTTWGELEDVIYSLAPLKDRECLCGEGGRPLLYYWIGGSKFWIAYQWSLQDFYNFMIDDGNEPIWSTTKKGQKGQVMAKYSSYLSAKMYSSTNGAPSYGELSPLMNGPIKEKLRIIPKNVSWEGDSPIVFAAMVGDFMKPRIQEVDELLAKGINVTIYNGQLDLICSTKGVEAWVDKLKWNGLKNYLSLDRTPLYCGNDNSVTKGFMRSHKNLFFYWILGAGHFVPVDQPCVSLQMVGNITRSPNYSS